MNSSILQPSTVTSGLCTRKGGPGAGSSVGGECATATSSRPPCLCLIICSKQVGSKAPSNLLQSTQQHHKHMFGRPKLRRSSRLPDLLQDTIQICCLLFTTLLAGCHFNRPFQRVCAQCAQKYCAFKCAIRYAPLLTLCNVFFC